MFSAFYVIYLTVKYCKKRTTDKMYDLKFKCLSIIVIICIFTVTISVNNSGHRDIVYILRIRNDIIENSISGKITYEETKRLLSEIECESVYTNDLKSIKAYVDCEHDKIIDINVLEIKEKGNINGLICFDGKIAVTFLSDSIVYTNINRYNIGVNDMNEDIKLVAFELVQ